MNDYWRGKHYSFFQNTACEYFPCHPTKHPENFNCIFCYCPLYALGETCGGNFRYTDSGLKDCSACMIPHLRGSYGRILDRFQDVAELARRPAADPEKP